jgi:outer membrane protein with beta-barrel domain
MDRSRNIHGWSVWVQIAGLCLAIYAVPAGAQDRRFELYAGVQPPGVIHSGDSTRLVQNNEYRLGLLYSWRPALSTELSATYGPDSDVATADGAVLYHFTGSSKWHPFVGGGLHWASLSYEVADRQFDDRGTALVVIGGVDWQFSRLVGLRFEARGLPVKLTGYHETIDDNVVASAGFTFRF